MKLREKLAAAPTVAARDEGVALFFTSRQSCAKIGVPGSADRIGVAEALTCAAAVPPHAQWKRGAERAQRVHTAPPIGDSAPAAMPHHSGCNQLSPTQNGWHPHRLRFCPTVVVETRFLPLFALTCLHDTHANAAHKSQVQRTRAPAWPTMRLGERGMTRGRFAPSWHAAPPAFSWR